MAISAAIKILQPEASKDYNLQIMVKKVIDGSENYVSLQDKQVSASENSGWIRIESFFTKEIKKPIYRLYYFFLNNYAGGWSLRRPYDDGVRDIINRNYHFS